MGMSALVLRGGNHLMISMQVLYYFTISAGMILLRWSKIAKTLYEITRYMVE